MPPCLPVRTRLHLPIRQRSFLSHARQDLQLQASHQRNRGHLHNLTSTRKTPPLALTYFHLLSFTPIYSYLLAAMASASLPPKHRQASLDSWMTLSSSNSFTHVVEVSLFSIDPVRQFNWSLPKRTSLIAFNTSAFRTLLLMSC